MPRYEPVRLLGKGAIGEVVLAVDTATGGLVALKRLRSAHAAAMRREFLTLNALRHPNLCRVWDFGYAGPGATNPFLVRDYVPGEDLGRRLGVLGFDQARAIAAQLLRALAYLHGRGVMHGDIKPANILVSDELVVKLIDFNLAQVVGARAVAAGGTPAYLPPERLTGARTQALPQDDLFALGVTLFQLLTGTLPIVSSVPEEIAAFYARATCLRPTRGLVEIPADLDLLVAGLTEADPRRRIADAKEAAARIDAPLDARPETASWVHFVGRKDALRALRDAIGAVRTRRRSFVLAVEGPEGGGKTRLLAQAVPMLKTAGFTVRAAWDRRDALRTLLEEPDAAQARSHDRVGDFLAGARTRTIALLSDDADPEALAPLIERARLTPGLRLLLVCAFRGDEGAALQVDARVRLGGLGAPECGALAADFFGCGEVPPEVADRLCRHSAGVPAALLALLRTASSAGALHVDTNGVLACRAELPALEVAPPPPARLADVFRYIELAGRPLRREIIVCALGRSGTTRIEEALARGLLVELPVAQGPRLAMARRPAQEALPAWSMHLRGLRLAAAYLRHGDRIGAARALLAVGALPRAALEADRASRACRRTRDAEGTAEALALAWQATEARSPAARVVRALRLVRHGSEALLSEARRAILARPCPPRFRALSDSFLAHEAERRGDWRAAYDSLAAACAACPVLPRALGAVLTARRAVAAFHLARKDEARATFQSVSVTPAPMAHTLASAAWARAQILAATGLGLLGERDAASAILDALAARGDLPDDARLQVLGERAIRAAERGDTAAALRAFKDVERAAVRLGDTRAHIGAILNQAIAEYKRRDLARAERLFRRAHALCSRRGDTAFRPAVACGRATVARQRGDFRAALALFHEALRIPGSRTGFRVNALNNMGEAYQLLGAGRRALATRGRAAELADQLGDQYLQALTLFGLYATQTIAGRPDPEVALRADRFAAACGATRLRAGAHYYRGLAAEACGAQQVAVAQFARGAAFARRAGDADYFTGCALAMARLLLCNGEAARASQIVARLQTTVPADTAWELRSEAALWQAFLAGSAGDLEHAVPVMERLCRDTGACPELCALAHLLLAGRLRSPRAPEGAWIPAAIEAADALERLACRGSKGSAARLGRLAAALFPGMLEPGSLPWAPLLPAPAAAQMSLVVSSERGLLRIAGGGALDANARVAARRALRTRTDVAYRTVQALHISPGAVAVLPASEAPDLRDICRVIVDFFRTASNLYGACLASFKKTEAGAAQGAQIETAIIGSRERDALAQRAVAAPWAGSEERFVADSRRLLKIVRELPQVARAGMPVLITGESGSGKDLVAHTLHRLSGRSGPFVVQPCGTLPEALLEAELFGVARGAFTGADEDRPGLLSLASGGTLYMDNVDGLSEAVQAKLLRVLQEGEARPLGGDSPVHLDFRLITSSRLAVAKLRERVREDFFFRVGGYVIALPALREQQESLPALVSELLRRWGERRGLPSPEIDPDALEALRAHAWPGNVRELRNVLERALVASPARLAKEHIRFGEDLVRRDQALDADSPLKHVRDEIERRYLVEVLARCEGSIGKSAARAGISRRHLLTLLKKHGLSASEGA